jgi:glycosyltransferase involved in cell wall biosynthesis
MRLAFNSMLSLERTSTIGIDIAVKGAASAKKNQKLPKTWKIAMLGSFPPLRGLSSYCLEIASALAASVNVEFISFKKIYPGFLYPGGDLRNDFTFPEPNTKGLRVRRRLTWYNPVTWVLEAMGTEADLLHAQWWSLPLVPVYLCICGIFKLRGKPIVFTIHNVLSHERSHVYKTASLLLFKLGDHFIVHTGENRRQLISHYGIKSALISVIPHGSLDFQVRDKIDPATVREELGIIPNRKVILLFGAIRRYKGVDTAIKALPRVAQEIPEAVLLIAGKLWQSWDPYQLLIERLRIKNSIVTVLDYVPSGEVYKYFEAADLVVLPYSRFDSQSGVGSTAVGFRKPMIVSDVGGLPDLVQDRRCIVPPEDPAALARAIIGCLSDAKRLATMTAGLEELATRLSWSAIAPKTITIYEKLLKRARKTSH